MKTVLITGGNGYLATSLYKKLNHIYDITTVSRETFDLTDHSATSSWLSDKRFDVVIHTAISGGSRLQQDTIDTLDSNLKMYYNLLDNRKSFNRFISIGSGAELYRTNTPYGMSKHVIHKSMLTKDEFYNVRVFAVFDENELPSRFIKANLLRYINKESMMIHNNMQMSFFYMKDFIKVIKHYISDDSPDKEFNCVYEESPYLLDIAEYINTLDNYTVDITQMLPPAYNGYVGVPNKHNLSYTGLLRGIQETYNILKNPYERI